MRTVIIAILLSATPDASPGLNQAPSIELRPGLVITRSVRIVPKTYRFSAPVSLDSSVITIRGDDVTVDFQGAVLQGMDPGNDPDRGSGIGIRISGGAQCQNR